MSKPNAGGASGAPAGNATETVKVMVRVRPMNTKEKQRGKSNSSQEFGKLISS